jgi:hypothetical protein
MLNTDDAELESLLHAGISASQGQVAPQRRI